MTTPSTLAKLDPAIDVLAKCLIQTCENYQQLLHQPDAYLFCVDAGLTLRRLSKRYAEVLITTLTYQSVLNEETEDWDEDNELPFDENQMD